MEGEIKQKKNSKATSNVLSGNHCKGERRGQTIWSEAVAESTIRGMHGNKEILPGEKGRWG